MKSKRWIPLVKRFQTRFGIETYKAEFKISEPTSANEAFNGEVVCKLTISGIWAGKYTSKVTCLPGDKFSKVDGQRIAFERAIKKHWDRVGRYIFGKKDQHLLLELDVRSKHSLVRVTQLQVLRVSQIFMHAIEKSSMPRKKSMKVVRVARKVIKAVSK